jgi:hypothetical protein
MFSSIVYNVTQKYRVYLIHLSKLMALAMPHKGLKEKEWVL